MIDRRALLALPGLILAAGAARASSFPARQIRIVVPFAAGGTTDFLGRVVGEKIGDYVGGQRTIIENRSGAGGAVGLREVAAAPADGHTLAMTDTSISITPTLNPGAGVSASMFAPISLVGSFPGVMVIHPDIPARTLQEFIAFCRASREPVTFGHGGLGTGPHMMGELFAVRAGVRMQQVAYRGNAPAIQDLVAGRIALVFSGAPTAIQHVRANTLRVIATTGAERLPSFADVPTAVEQGMRDFVTEQWFGVLSAAGTPADVVARLNELVVNAVRDPSITRQIGEQGGIPRGTSAAEFAAHIESQTRIWADVIRQANLQI